MTIYLASTLLLVGWWAFLCKLVRLGRARRTTSIADRISSRYDKSPLLDGLVTVPAVVVATPQIALQLQSVTLSFEVRSGDDLEVIAVPVAIGLADFTIVFGTCNLELNERHNGILTAIALEAVVKLVALLAAGAFVVWGVAGGTSATGAICCANECGTRPIQTGSAKCSST